MSQTHNEVAKKSNLKQPQKLLNMENKKGDIVFYNDQVARHSWRKGPQLTLRTTKKQNLSSEENRSVYLEKLC